MSLELGTVSGKIDLDTAAFERKYATVDAALSKLESAGAAEVKVDADTQVADRKLNAVEAFMSGVLDGMSAELEVAADTSTAERKLDAIEAASGVIDGMKSEIRVNADTRAAENALDGIADKAGDAGDDAGAQAGDGMAAGIIGAIVSIPIAGAIVGAGVAIGKGLLDGIKDGLSVEVGRDLFSAKTGLDEQTAARFGRAAGNAYANVFGESVEANLDTARQALQAGLIDGDATAAEIEKVIAGLDTVTTILDEDVPRVSRAAGVMLKTGLAIDAQDAFDQMVAGAQAGVNVSEDLIDTFTEYPALFQRLGLDGPVAMGLISQAMKAGARDTDYAADALKEFQIRATDGSEASAEAFKALGMDAEDMTAKIAAGGQGAADGLGAVLQGLRDIEDPVLRTQTAVGLFGTKAEDLGDALFAMDTSTAVQQLGNFEGAARTAMETLGDNPAAAIEGAQRNIEIAADGIKGALASAFGEPLGDLSDWVSNNRAGVMEFFGGVTNAAFELGIAGVEGFAAMMEAAGDFVSDTGPAVVETFIGIIEAIDAIPGIDIDADTIVGKLRGMQQGMHEFGLESYMAADELRAGLIDNGIVPIQEKFNEFLADEVLVARVQDTTNIMASSIDNVGASLDNLNGISMDPLTGSLDTSTEAGALLDEQLRVASGSMFAAQEAAIAAGQGQDELNGKWGTAYGLLVDQIVQMGYTRDQAVLLAEQYRLFPRYIDTKIRLDTSGASYDMDNFLHRYQGRTLTTYQMIRQVGQAPVATGGDVDAHAAAALGRTHLAGGGSVVGPGTGTSDDVPAAHPSGVQFWLSNGEHVLTADDVLDLGGQQGAYALRAMIQAGMVKPLEQGPRMAEGGAVGPVGLAAPTGATVHVDMPVTVMERFDTTEAGARLAFVVGGTL